MQTIITLSGIKKLFSNNNPKRVLKRRKIIYDEQWKMYFDSELERKKFISEIAQAEEDIRCGRVCTMEEMKEEFRKEFGIEL